MEINSAKVEEIREIKEIDIYRKKFENIRNRVRVLDMQKYIEREVGVTRYRFDGFVFNNKKLTKDECMAVDKAISNYIKHLLDVYENTVK